MPPTRGRGGLVFQTNSKDSAWPWQFLKWKREKNFSESSRQDVKLYVNFHCEQTGWLLMIFLPFISSTWSACKIAEGTGGGGGCSCCYLVTKSCPTLCDPMDYIAWQAPLSMEFSRQENCNGLPFPAARDLSGPGIKPTSCVSPALAGGFFTTEPPGKPHGPYTYTQTMDWT